MPNILPIRLTIPLLCLSLGCAVRADVKMPAIFGDHMVLQRDAGVPLWGTADAGEKVTVTAGSDKAETTAGADGTWTVKLEKLPASTTPIDVTVAGKNTLTFHDVLVGDVWVCSGQSNMEFGIRAFIQKKEDFDKTGNPMIRLFSVPKFVSPGPAKEIAPAPVNFPDLGHWEVCTPESLTKTGEWSGFPATGYYFGSEIQAFTHQPVGLIGSCWGGTRINSWISLKKMETVPAMASYAKGAANFQNNYEQIEKTYQTVDLPAWTAAMAKWKEDNKAALDAYDAEVKDWQQKSKDAAAAHQPAPPRPGKGPRPPMKTPVDPMTNNQNSAALFNGMIVPIIPYAIKGVIWYQGESNGDQPEFYKIALPALIEDWRAHWGQGDFTFMVVQLPNFMQRKPEPSESNWAGVREAQAKAMSIPNTGLAVTIDIGDAGVIHPSDKFDVGHRLALAAEHATYGLQTTYTGPTYKSLKVEGNKLRVTFDNIGSGLIIGTPPETYFAAQKVRPPAPDTSKLLGFAIAGADNKYVWADAAIDGDSVVLSSAAVPQPVSVRYAWADNPACNLYNKEGLPAAPFRTDDLPVQK